MKVLELEKSKAWFLYKVSPHYFSPQKTLDVKLVFRGNQPDAYR